MANHAEIANIIDRATLCRRLEFASRDAYKALGRRADTIADFGKAQSIDPSDQVSREQLRGFGG